MTEVNVKHLSHRCCILRAILLRQSKIQTDELRAAHSPTAAQQRSGILNCRGRVAQNAIRRLILCVLIKRSRYEVGSPWQRDKIFSSATKAPLTLSSNNCSKDAVISRVRLHGDLSESCRITASQEYNSNTTRVQFQGNTVTCRGAA